MIEIEDFYPLSPLQAGMLYHILVSPESGAYVSQFCCELNGELDVLAWERAWQRVVDRHAILRTLFVWEDVKEPIQVVQKTARVRIADHDWRGLAEDERHEKLAKLRRVDLSTSFDLKAPPLMRLTVIRIKDDVYELMWTHQHLLLDGWSVPILVKEVLVLYDAFCRGTELVLPQLRPFRDYIVWLKSQDHTSAQSFWKGMLKDFCKPTRLKDQHSSLSGEPDRHFGEATVTIPSGKMDELRSFARSNELTLNTIFQGAWALLLGYDAGVDDVAFGATVSGRPAQLRGVESMVGMFINTMPVRVRIPPAGVLADWLGDIQTTQVEARQYEYSSLAQIQASSGVPRGVPLFDTIIVFENYPAGTNGNAGNASPTVSRFTMTNVRHTINEDYPLVLAIEPGTSVLLQLRYDCRLFSESAARRILRKFSALLDSFTSREDSQLSVFSSLIDELDLLDRAGNEARVKQSRQDRLKEIQRRAASGRLSKSGV